MRRIIQRLHGIFVKTLNDSAPSAQTRKVEEGFSMTVKDLVKNLSSSFKQFM